MQASLPRVSSHSRRGAVWCLQRWAHARAPSPWSHARGRDTKPSQPKPLEGRESNNADAISRTQLPIICYANATSVYIFEQLPLLGYQTLTNVNNYIGVRTATKCYHVENCELNFTKTQIQHTTRNCFLMLAFASLHLRTSGTISLARVSDGAPRLPEK